MARKIPLNLNPGAVEHYLDAAAYERRYEARTEDVDYYVKKLRGRTRVLEYGAGAGRLTMALVRANKRVTAVEVSRSMADLLAQRKGLLEKERQRDLEIRVADMRTFSTKQRFDAVVVGFHTLCHLYSLDDIREFLGHAFAHLTPGGTLEADLPLPRIDMAEYDPIAQVRVTEVDEASGPQLLTQRWYHPQEIAMHLHYAGFEQIRLCADFTSAPIDRETSVFTVSGKKPKRAH